MADNRSLPPQDGSSGLRPDLERIIASGRKTKRTYKGSLLGATGLISVSLVLLYCSFSPLEFAPAAWVALVPLIPLVQARYLPRGTFLVLTGLAFFWSLATLQWMRLGHVTMYGALFALAAYLSLYFPAFLLLSRRLVSSGRIPVWLAVPLVWVALEYARAYLLTGFSWYYLGHSQYRWLTLIQISDITGAYGVSFLVAIVSSVIGCLLPQRLISRSGLDAEQWPSPAHSEGRSSLVNSWAGPVVASTLLVGALIYGTIRLQASTSVEPGPTFALVQGNFSPEVKHNPGEWNQRYRIHDHLTRHCVELRPQFIVWPETMFPWPDQAIEEGLTDSQISQQFPPQLLEAASYDKKLLIEKFRSGEVRASLGDHSKLVGTSLIIGLESHVITSEGLKAYNSVAFVRPDLGYIGRYDKIHRVIFGEYIPLKDIFPWLSNLTPFGPNFGIAAGKSPAIFETPTVCAAPLICFEDTVPHLVRRIAAQKNGQGKEVSVLVNVTNDAWFRGSSELDQHLITSAFRCVENRVPMVRAVNGGISAFIDGNGEIREPAQILELDAATGKIREVKGLKDPSTGKWRRQFNGIVFGEVPNDPRSSLYLRFGDVFARLCLIATLVGLVASWSRGRPARPTG